MKRGMRRVLAMALALLLAMSNVSPVNAWEDVEAGQATIGVSTGSLDGCEGTQPVDQPIGTETGNVTPVNGGEVQPGGIVNPAQGNSGLAYQNTTGNLKNLEELRKVHTGTGNPFSGAFDEDVETDIPTEKVDIANKANPNDYELPAETTNNATTTESTGSKSLEK